MRWSATAAAVFCLSLCPMPVKASDAARVPIIDAPRDLVGPTVFNWVAALGPNYLMTDTEAGKSLHDGSPVVYFTMTDGQTAVRFGVNLIHDTEMLLKVESTSQRFLTHVGVDRLDYDEDGKATLEYCWDAGCHELQASVDAKGHYSAVWSYYYD